MMKEPSTLVKGFPQMTGLSVCCNSHTCTHAPVHFQLAAAALQGAACRPPLPMWKPTTATTVPPLPTCGRPQWPKQAATLGRLQGAALQGCRLCRCVDLGVSRCKHLNNSDVCSLLLIMGLRLLLFWWYTLPPFVDLPLFTLAKSARKPG